MQELAIVEDKVQFIKIRISDEDYGLEIKNIENIVRMQHITRVPNVADYIKGVINLRGVVIPVFNLRLKMGLPEIEENKSFRIIILKIDGDNVGLIVDEVKEVVTLTGNQIEKIYHNPADTTQNFLMGVGKDGENLISLLDINEVLADKSNVQ